MVNPKDSFNIFLTRFCVHILYKATSALGPGSGSAQDPLTSVDKFQPRLLEPALSYCRTMYPPLPITHRTTSLSQVKRWLPSSIMSARNLRKIPSCSSSCSFQHHNFCCNYLSLPNGNRKAKGKQGRTPTSLLPEPVDLVQFQPPTVSESEWAKMLFKAVSAHVTSGDKPMT
ncbi:hypothetical protein BDV98DRAFT_260277 [Pterulicium gracile]|uniref:Uncharacterized protein n=1 Tax=Pterulicium gracile TaxID=1884261 RepID=A0A5C3Q683_9AGAR|nr:hypothetical protein BDV98DRAFT_260277 [Pterula gracilis]